MSKISFNFKKTFKFICQSLSFFAKILLNTMNEMREKCRKMILVKLKADSNFEISVPKTL